MVRGARNVNATAAVSTVTRIATKRPVVRRALQVTEAGTVTKTSTSVTPKTRVTNTPPVATQSAPSNVSVPLDSRSSTPLSVKVHMHIIITQ